MHIPAARYVCMGFRRASAPKVMHNKIVFQIDGFYQATLRAAALGVRCAGTMIHKMSNV
jgi:hypothetical protein